MALRLGPKFWIPIIFTAICAFGAVVLQWWLTRTTTPVIGYTVSTVQIGTTPELRGLLPSLELKVENKAVDSVSVHTVAIRSVEGRYDRELTVAIDFPKHGEIVGFRAFSPSPTHSVRCEKYHLLGLKCVLRPVAQIQGSGEPSEERDAYRIQVGTTGGAMNPGIKTSGDFMFQSLTPEDRNTKATEPFLFAFLAVVVASALQLFRTTLNPLEDVMKATFEAIMRRLLQ